MIPKILHQTGPSDFSIWHPLWKKCQESWKIQFRNFDYKFWNDSEIDDLIHQEYPQYSEMYFEFPVHIMKIDFVRFAFMHKYGGIYADLDFFCYKNFHNQITKSDIYLLQNPFGNDPIENSLFCSVPNHPFWIDCMNEVQTRFDKIKKTQPELFEHTTAISCNEAYGLKIRPWLLFHVSGTSLLSYMYRKYQKQYNIDTLSGMLYNNRDSAYTPDLYTRHIHTGVWGKENHEVIKKIKRNYGSIKNFDFYYDYSGGDYIKTEEQLQHMLDVERNNIDPQPFNLSTKFNYV